MLVVSNRGYAQLGNALSFLGGLATLGPPLNQVRKNQKFSTVIAIPPHPDLAELDEELENQRRLSFMAFKPFDFTMLVGGLLLVSLGFLVSIIASPTH